MEDRNIILLLTERDQRAITELQQKYRSYCLFIAKSILGNEEDAEECVNDTYLGVWNSIPPNSPADLRPYVGAVCRKTALKRLEQRMAEKRGGGRSDLVYEELDNILGGSSDFCDEIALRDALQKFLGSLTDQARRIFMQHYWFFRTVAEISEDLGVREDSVRSSLFRSREKLKKFLIKEGFVL